MSTDLAGIGEVFRATIELIRDLIEFRRSRPERLLKLESLQLQNEEQALKNEASRLKNEEQQWKNRDRKLRHATKVLILEERLINSERRRPLPRSATTRKH